MTYEFNLIISLMRERHTLWRGRLGTCIILQQYDALELVAIVH